MRRGLEQAFDECLARMRRGESLEACLEEYPQDKQELESMLRFAGALINSYHASAPPTQTLTRGRAAFLGQAVELQKQSEQASWAARLWQSLRASRSSRALGSLALAFVFMVVALAGGSMVSANSLPGDALYGIKRASEQVRYVLTLDEVNRAELEAAYQEIRRQEIVEVLDQQRVTQVAFSGVVESMRGDTITISGIAIQLAGDMVRHRPEIGAEVSIVAETQPDGTVNASDVQVLAAAPATPTPIPPTATAVPPTQAAPAQVAPTRPPTATPPPTKTQEPTATETAVPSETPEATATSEETLEASATPSDTPTATAMPSSTPWPTFTMAPPPQEVTVRIEGSIDEIDDDYWRVNGQQIKISSSTSIKQDAALAQVGGWAVVRATQKPDNSLQAEEIEVLRGPDTPPEPVEFSGVIESYNESQWIVSGKTLAITNETTIDGTPQVGAQAHVDAKRMSDGQLVADHITVVPELEIVQFEGVVQSIASDSWTVAGQVILVDSSTVIEGSAVVGAIAEVQAVVQTDGTKQAQRIVIMWAPEPTAEPTATPEPTVEPTTQTESTASPEPTEQAEPTATAEPAVILSVPTVQGKAAIDVQPSTLNNTTSADQ